MQAAPDFSFMPFRIKISKFGTFGSLSNKTFGSYVRPSNWWRSTGSLITSQCVLQEKNQSRSCWDDVSFLLWHLLEASRNWFQNINKTGFIIQSKMLYVVGSEVNLDNRLVNSLLKKVRIRWQEIKVLSSSLFQVQAWDANCIRFLFGEVDNQCFQVWYFH